MSALQLRPRLPGVRRALLLPWLVLPLAAQSWVISPAPRLELPVRPDGNSPTFWAAGTFRVFTSTGEPLMISVAGNQ
ncbi:MAG: hypothetical protein N2036_10760, partial [Bryobacteraceae bacterium]|nr:hypothetical protein [Bryobacteraceae bacterium]